MMKATNMKKARLKANLSQTELARRVNLSQTDISNIEIGKIFPSKCVCDAINKTLKANIDWSMHPEAPLNSTETRYLLQVQELMIQNGESPQKVMKFLAKQSNSFLRGLFKFAGVTDASHVEPLHANTNLHISNHEEKEDW